VISSIHSEGTWAARPLLDMLNTLVTQAPTRTVVVTGTPALAQWLGEQWAPHHVFLPMVCPIEALGHVLDPGTSPLSDMQQLDWQSRTVALLAGSYRVQANSLQLPTTWAHAVTWLGMDPPPEGGWLPGLEGLPFDVFRRQAFRALDDAGYLPSVRVWGRWRESGWGAFAQWANGKTVVYIPSPIDPLGLDLMSAVWQGCDAGVVMEQVIPGHRPLALFGGHASVVPWTRPQPSVAWWTCESDQVQAVQVAEWIAGWSSRVPLSEIGVVCPSPHCDAMAVSLGQLGIPVRVRRHRPLVSSPLAAHVLAQLAVSHDPSPSAMLAGMATWGKDMTESDDVLLIKRALVRIVKESAIGGGQWARWATLAIKKGSIPTLGDPGGVWVLDPVGAIQLPVSMMVITHATSTCYPSMGHPLARPRVGMGSAGSQAVLTHLLHQATQSVRVLTPLEMGGVPQTPSVVMTHVMTAHATRTHHTSEISDDMARAVRWQVASRSGIPGLQMGNEGMGSGGSTEQEIGNEKAGRISPSRLQRYQTCPHLYWMMDELGIDPSTPDLGLSPADEGTLVHQVMEWGAGYLKTVRGDVGGMLDMITSNATSRWQREPYKEWWAFCRWLGEAGRRGPLYAALMHLYEWAQGMEIVATEYRPPARILADGTLVSGIIDLVGRDRQTGSLIVVDYKTGMMPTIKEVSRLESLPLSVYAWLLQADPSMGEGLSESGVSAMAWRIHPSEFKTQWLMATAMVRRTLVPPRCRPFEPTGDHYEGLETRMTQITQGIKGKRFHPHDMTIIPPPCDRCVVRWGCRYRGVGTVGGTVGGIDNVGE